MSEDRTERRLAAILAADMVGYSRLMAADEVGTIERQKAHRAALIDPKIGQYGGRIVKTTGDGLLAEFPSVVDAVQCAAEIQRTMPERERGVPDEQRIRYRVGINIGDIVVEGDDIYGDGVNVAARLETLAEPGGICVSHPVHVQVDGKVDLAFEDLGPKDVKNIPKPVQVFRVLLDGLDAKQGSAAASTGRPMKWSVWVGAGLLLVVLAVIALWQRPWEAREEPASEADMAFPLPDRPSIAVLPFDNMSGDASQEYFADGMTEDLITDLSKISGLFVIARNSSFAYKGASVKIKQVAEDLGVRYVLEGSVRRAGDQLRVNAQLVDATTGGHVWADRFDGDTADIFAVQDKFVLKIVKALELQLSDREQSELAKSDTEKIDAREAFQRGWELYSRFNEQDNARAVSHFEEAVRLDPEYGRAYGALALVHLRGSIFHWQRAMGKTRAQLYRELVPFYLQQASRYPTALTHVVAAMQHLFYWDQAVAEGAGRGTDDARVEAGYAMALQPNDPEAHIVMAWAMIASGKPEEGLNFVRAAMRLDPNYPSHYVFFNAAAHFAMGDLEQAASVLKEGLARDPHAVALAPLAASVYARLGQRPEARKALEIWRPGASRADLQESAEGYDFPIRWVDEHQPLGRRLKDGLRLAALPLDVTVASLTAELDRGSPFEQMTVVRALGWFGPAAAAAVRGLVEALGSEHKVVRKEAAITLGKIGPDAKAAVPALAEIADEPIVGFHAKEALREIDGN